MFTEFRRQQLHITNRQLGYLPNCGGNHRPKLEGKVKKIVRRSNQPDVDMTCTVGRRK